MPIKKEIVYPIFLECCQYTDDIFWENIFEDLAYGKPPYGTYISKDFLCCSYKKKEFSYKIEKKDSKTIYDEVYNILTNKLELLSHREKINKRKDFTDVEDVIRESRKNWNDIKKKNMKELLIELYVTRMKTKHSLTIQQARFLSSVITLGIIFKVILPEDIDYKNDSIQNIKGIDFINKRVILEKDLYSFELSFAPVFFTDKKIMSENWEKFLKELRKYVL